MPGVYAIFLISLLQVLNYYAIYGSYFLFINEHPKIYKYIGVILFVVLCIIYYLRFYKATNYNELCEKWDYENKVKRKKRGVLIVIYIILSVVIGITIPSIIGARNNPDWIKTWQYGE